MAVHHSFLIKSVVQLMSGVGLQGSMPQLATHVQSSLLGWPSTANQIKAKETELNITSFSPPFLFYFTLVWCRLETGEFDLDELSYI